MPKPREVPSLDFLKGFDAAARHMSFTLAAEEMFLTQSARVFLHPLWLQYADWLTLQAQPQGIVLGRCIFFVQFDRH